jgi:hypothetical protein
MTSWPLEGVSERATTNTSLAWRPLAAWALVVSIDGAHDAIAVLGRSGHTPSLSACSRYGRHGMIANVHEGALR